MEGREGEARKVGEGEVEKKKREGEEEGNQERGIRGGKGVRSEEKVEGGRRRGSRVFIQDFSLGGGNVDMCNTPTGACTHQCTTVTYSFSILLSVVWGYPKSISSSSSS